MEAETWTKRENEVCSVCSVIVEVQSVVHNIIIINPSRLLFRTVIHVRSRRVLEVMSQALRRTEWSYWFINSLINNTFKKEFPGYQKTMPKQPFRLECWTINTYLMEQKRNIMICFIKDDPYNWKNMLNENAWSTKKQEMTKTALMKFTCSFG
jgi:hypothetical protein